MKPIFKVYESIWALPSFIKFDVRGMQNTKIRNANCWVADPSHKGFGA